MKKRTLLVRHRQFSRLVRFLTYSPRFDFCTGFKNKLKITLDNFEKKNETRLARLFSRSIANSLINGSILIKIKIPHARSFRVFGS